MSESVKKTFFVAAALCVVCSIVVSSAVVLLKGKQEINKDLDFKKNILEAAGLLEGNSHEAIIRQFSSIEAVVVDLNSGEIVSDAPNFDQEKADKDPDFLEEIGKVDPAGIRRRSKWQTAYLVRNSEGRIDQVVLRVYGRGLWSTMYGFVALDHDVNTIRGFSYYEHAETPGLGGEIDNPRWKTQWRGKRVFDDSFNPALVVAKGVVDKNSPGAEFKVDGLSGATITANGVQGTFRYWMSEKGYRPFLARVKEGKIL